MTKEFRSIGFFWTWSDYYRIRKELEKAYPKKKFQKRFELIEILEPKKKGG